MKKETVKMKQNVLGLVACLLIMGLAFLVPSRSEAAGPRTPAAIQAEGFFWAVFNGGAYEQIPDILNAMTGAYLGDPTDATTAAHIGWTHLWKLTEQLRMAQIPPTITDHAILARQYFERAVYYRPSDARYLSDLAAAEMTVGFIHRQPELVNSGYEKMKKSIFRFPEFNLFTDGYTQSRLPPQTDFFKVGLENLWKNVDVCIGTKMNRNNPDMRPYMHLATTVGPKRVCWNGGWMTPHNFEGFFLNLGDVLVKAGQWEIAQKAYVNARLVPEYKTWKYAPMLEARIINAQANVTLFNAPPGPNGRIITPVMAQSEVGCLGCHQN